jgi:hypothetical protein
MSAQHVELYNISELHFGNDRGFAGYVDHRRMTVGDFGSPDDAITDFRANPNKSPYAKPKRKKPGNQGLDTPLAIIAGAGAVQYVLVLGEKSGIHFDATDPILLLPLKGEPSPFITDIKVLDNGHAVSFIFDADAVKKSKLGAKIAQSPHNSAIRIPFCLNLIDDGHDFPEWTIDDFRFEPNQPPPMPSGSDPKLAALTGTFSHGGVHPPGVLSHGGVHPDGVRSHGGVHPPGASSYIVVELP